MLCQGMGRCAVSQILTWIRFFFVLFCFVFLFFCTERQYNCIVSKSFFQVPVVRRSDNAIHWINLYLVDNAIRFAITYLLDSDLSVGQRYPALYNWAQVDNFVNPLKTWLQNETGIISQFLSFPKIHDNFCGGHFFKQPSSYSEFQFAFATIT